MTLTLLGQLSGPVIACCAVVGLIHNWRQTRKVKARLSALEAPDAPRT